MLRPLTLTLVKTLLVWQVQVRIVFEKKPALCGPLLFLDVMLTHTQLCTLKANGHLR